MRILIKLIWSLSFVLIFIGCSETENPEVSPSDQKLKTRGSSEISNQISQTEAISIADRALDRGNAFYTKSVDALVNVDQEYSQGLLSDTLAYIIKYGDSNGYAIVANDQRVSRPIAYSHKGSYTNDPSILKYFVLDRIPKFMWLLNNGALDNKLNAVPAGRCIVEPQIDVPISILPPFSDKIAKDFGCFNAGFGVVSTATLLSFFYDNFTLNNYAYDFKGMVYALKQGPGYTPVIPILPIVPNDHSSEIGDINPPITFIDSYDGAISAYNQLLYDIGMETNTRYYVDGRTFT
ncbi:MAG: Spi family protease inhibitor [Lachnospiraceae bacterium]|nr:Spi family protease inhibitor [Lachnospiraceae bacterium]